MFPSGECFRLGNVSVWGRFPSGEGFRLGKVFVQKVADVSGGVGSDRYECGNGQIKHNKTVAPFCLPEPVLQRTIGPTFRLGSHFQCPASDDLSE